MSKRNGKTKEAEGYIPFRDVEDVRHETQGCANLGLKDGMPLAFCLRR